MYNNIGGKIKSLAKWTFIAETVAMVLAGITVLIEEEDFLLCFVCVLLGPVVAWVSSWLLYGFGEIITKLTDIERNTYCGGIKSMTRANADSERIARIEKLYSQGLITEEEYLIAISSPSATQPRT